MNNSIKVRELVNLQDQDSGRKIFDLTWAMDTGTEITPNLLQAMVHSGSYLSGAFIENKLVGAAFAFPATNNGLHFHSHMTAVLDEYTDQGVGYALKIDQWNWAKKQKYPYLSWTFDPLVRRNAKFNVVKLGVDISAYHPNFYGEMPDVINTGDESDRLMASWRTDTDAPKPRELIKHLKPDDILIEIPEDIFMIRFSNKTESAKWRRQVRDQFMIGFANNFKVIGLSINHEYILRRSK
jgi:predicted GNAT superfamily acetyltransferase